WFVTQAHSPAHIGICAGECNAGDGPKDKQDVQLFLAATLTILNRPLFNNHCLTETLHSTFVILDYEEPCGAERRYDNTALPEITS
ncbi:MAG: hypothetical protein V2J65_25635, partial [Desulfobacteraceae bacterium]|nr:hypothetical protein [Desulfobacteraceae bacterium]